VSGADNGFKFALDQFLDRREKLGKEFHGVPNFMKHADWDPDGWLENLSAKSAYLTLALAIILWTALGEAETALMTSFWQLSNPLLPGHKAEGGLKFIQQRKDELVINLSDQDTERLRNILNMPSS
jgi:hypothetical protein